MHGTCAGLRGWVGVMLMTAVIAGAQGCSSDAGSGAEGESSAAGGEYSLVPEGAEPIENVAKCSSDEFVDYGCDARIEPLSGGCEPGKVIGREDDDACPLCVEAERAETTCESASADYRAFLSGQIGESCANYCASDDDCFLWQNHNACGTVAIPLFGGIDEEPILFAEMFAGQRCDVCGAVEQSLVVKRPDGRIDPEGASGALLNGYRPACDEDAHVCVLVEEAGHDD
jgi:hypothetical protein